MALALTHKELIIRARQLLQSRFGCNPVFTEQGSAEIREMPDAIGWCSGECWLIECKVTIGDLQADKKKPHRKQGGLGNRRFFLVSYELYLLTKPQLPDCLSDGWGLIIANPPRTPRMRSIVIDSGDHQSNLRAERDFLRSRILEIQRFGK